MGTFQQPVPDDRVRQLVQILHEPLDPRGDQRRVRLIVPAVHQAGDLRQGPVAAGTPERFQHRPLPPAVLQQHLD